LTAGRKSIRSEGEDSVLLATDVDPIGSNGDILGCNREIGSPALAPAARRECNQFPVTGFSIRAYSVACNQGIASDDRVAESEFCRRSFER